MVLQVFSFFFLASTFRVHVSAKECTNIPTQLSSHTIRAELMFTKNETWKSEMLSHYHLTPTDESTWMDLLPRKLAHGKSSSREEFDWAMLYRSLKGSSGINSWQQEGGFLEEVSLHDVWLDPDSIHGQAQQTNLEYLCMLDVNRLVWNFRKQAGLPTPSTPYGGWEGPNVELRGHFMEGQIVYQGPREHLLDFFEYMGFRCPEGKGVADVMQEVTSRKDQQLYWSRRDEPYRFVAVQEFAHAFSSFHVGSRLQDELRVPFDRSKNHSAALTTSRYGIGQKELFKACLSREFLLMKRNSFVYFVKLFQLIYLGFIVDLLIILDRMLQPYITA